MIRAVIIVINFHLISTEQYYKGCSIESTVDLCLRIPTVKLGTLAW